MAQPAWVMTVTLVMLVRWYTRVMTGIFELLCCSAFYVAGREKLN